MKQALLIIAAHDVMPLDFINRTHLDPFIPLKKLWEQFKSYKYEHFPTQIREADHSAHLECQGMKLKNHMLLTGLVYAVRPSEEKSFSRVASQIK